MSPRPDTSAAMHAPRTGQAVGSLAHTWLRSVSRRIWLVLSAAWAVVIGLLPHVLHHAGPLAGAALIAGVGGSLLFGIFGLLVAIPFLRRLYRRFGSWRAPAIAVVLFAAVFSFSTFVVGPRLSGENDTTSTGSGSSSMPASHAAHHR